MTQCFPFAQGRRLRVTKLDNCGNPLDQPGDTCVRVVSSGFIQVSLSSEMINGTTIEPLNANGDLCYQVRSKDQFARHTTSIEFCEVDPSLFSIVTNAIPVLDWNNEIVGFETIEGAPDWSYALEVWMGVPGVDCPEAGENPVDSLGYVLLPRIEPGALGDFSIANAAINFTVGGFTRGNGNWGQGPYDVVAQDADNLAGPLIDPVASNAHMHLQWTSVPAPDAFCGCLALGDGSS